MMLKRQGSISPYVGQPQEGEEEGKPRGRLARQPSLMLHQGAEPQGEVRASMQETDRENGDAFDATPAPGGVGLKRTGSMMLVQGGPGMRRAGSRSLIVVDNNMRTTQVITLERWKECAHTIRRAIGSYIIHAQLKVHGSRGGWDRGTQGDTSYARASLPDRLADFCSFHHLTCPLCAHSAGRERDQRRGGPGQHAAAGQWPRRAPAPRTTEHGQARA